MAPPTGSRIYHHPKNNQVELQGDKLSSDSISTSLGSINKYKRNKAPAGIKKGNMRSMQLGRVLVRAQATVYKQYKLSVTLRSRLEACVCSLCCSDLTVFFPPSSTYCGLSDPSNRHSEAQQGVVLILRQPQQLGDILESLGRGIPVQTSCGLTERHSKWSQLFHID